MVQLAHSKKRGERDQLVHRIQDHEHRGDAITHRIFSELNSTFVTPFDREDIHELASSLDDVMDHMHGSAARLSIYDLKHLPEPMVRLTQVLLSSIEELLRGVQYLKDLHHPEPIKTVLQKVNECENEADAIVTADPNAQVGAQAVTHTTYPQTLYLADSFEIEWCRWPSRPAPATGWCCLSMGPISQRGPAPETPRSSSRARP